MTEASESVSTSRYVGIYIACSIGASLAIILLFTLFPTLAQSLGKSSALSVAPKIVAAMVAYQSFVRKYVRLLIKEEYWEIVAYCAAANFLWEAILFGVTALGGAIPTDFSVGIVVIFVVIAGLVSFVIPAAGFSSWSGNILLKAELKRRAAIESRDSRRNPPGT